MLGDISNHKATLQSEVNHSIHIHIIHKNLFIPYKSVLQLHVVLKPSRYTSVSMAELIQRIIRSASKD